MHAGRRHTVIQTHRTQIALGHPPVCRESGCAEGAGQLAAVAADAQIAPDIHNAGGIMTENGAGGARHQAGRIAAVKTSDGNKCRPSGERADFQKVYPAKGIRCGQRIVLILAGDDTGITT